MSKVKSWPGFILMMLGLWVMFSAWKADEFVMILIGAGLTLFGRLTWQRAGQPIRHEMPEMIPPEHDPERLAWTTAYVERMQRRRRWHRRLWPR